MKKIILLAGIVLAMTTTSCFSTHPVATSADYQAARDVIASNMEANGYKASGQSTDEKNEVVVTDHTYNSKTGYSNRLDNNFQTYDTYSFAGNGGTAEYKLKYNAVTADNGSAAMTNVQVLGCSTSKGGDYSKVCEGSKSPNQVLSNMSKSSTYTELDWVKTTLLTCGIIFGLAAVAAIIAATTTGE